MDAKILLEFGLIIAGIIGAWAAMKTQVSDLRKDSDKKSEQINKLELEQARLGERHNGFGEKLDGALDKLESVTGQLQQIAIQIARGASSK